MELGIGCGRCSGASLALVTTGGGSTRIALTRSPFGVVTRDPGFTRSGGALGLTLQGALGSTPDPT